MLKWITPFLIILMSIGCVQSRPNPDAIKTGTSPLDGVWKQVKSGCVSGNLTKIAKKNNQDIETQKMVILMRVEDASVHIDFKYYDDGEPKSEDNFCHMTATETWDTSKDKVLKIHGTEATYTKNGTSNCFGLTEVKIPQERVHNFELTDHLLKIINGPEMWAPETGKTIKSTNFCTEGTDFQLYERIL